MLQKVEKLENELSRSKQEDGYKIVDLAVDFTEKLELLLDEIFHMNHFRCYNWKFAFIH